MAISRKKAILRPFDAPPASGYLPSSSFVEAGDVVLLLPDGRANPFAISAIKWIAYVRDFNLDDPETPERLGRRAFPARPRGDGLWLKLGFRDGEELEGLAAFDAGFLDTLIEDRGLFLTPPDGRSNTQRLFVPRAALVTVGVLGVVSAPSRRAAAERARAAVEIVQTGLFDL
jgi:hypothetical protein